MNGDVAAFGALLCTCRQSARLSQQELAARSGLSVRTVRNLERGRTRWPHPDSVHRLAAALELGDEARGEFIAAAGRRLSDAAPARMNAVPAQRPPMAGNGHIVPRQLPGVVREFVGRDDELATLTKMLDAAGASTPAAVVISVIGGTAGVGKTALAVHWAHRVAGDFPDGQLYVNLRGYDADVPMLASAALAGFLRALGLAGQDIPSDPDERAAAYRSMLAGRRVLVVLDNASQVEQVRPLLPGSPTCVTVVTSRDALTGVVAGDGAFRLGVDLLPLPEAVGLLRGLIGRRVDDDLAAAQALASQCCRLPLALRVAAELAAATPDVPLAGLVSELADLRHRLDVLETGEDERTAVRAVFSWSYRHLDRSTASAFRLVSLHPGPGLDRYAIAALTRTPLDLASRQLQKLARAHLIQTSGPGRYGLHDLLRGYARELADGQDGDEGKRAALTGLFGYYLHTAAAAMDAAFPAERHRRPPIPPPATPAPTFSEAAAALAWLAAELPTLVAVTGHAAEHGWPSHATRMAATLFRYLDTGGHFAEAGTIHAHARRAAQRTGDAAAEADALIGIGLVDGHQGRHHDATGHFEHALALYRQTGNQAGQARALNYLGLVQFHQGRYQQATSNYQQAVTLFHSAGEWTGEAYALSNLGVIGLRQGDPGRAGDYQRQALARFREIGDRHGEASVLVRLGLADLRQGRCQQAAYRLQQARTHYHSLGDRQGEADIDSALGLVDARQGHYRQAISRLRPALASYQELGDPSGQAITLNALGEVLLAAGRPADARTQYAAALDQAARAGEKYEQARAHHGLASACQASGDLPEAHRHGQEALTLYTYLGLPEADQVRPGLAAGMPDS
jgi:tetratricopeptide (TPR) repeat protein